jgi:hypothetical protein
VPHTIGIWLLPTISCYFETVSTINPPLLNPQKAEKNTPTTTLQK